MGKKALIVVDVLNCFCPNGSLAVPNGDEIVGIINERRQNGDYDYSVFVAEDHPANHCSFQCNGGMWPVHGVSGSYGAEFHTGLRLYGVDLIVKKGQDPKVDSYSAFYDNDHKNKTILSAWLKERGVTDVDVCGLAFEYCVKFTALDAVSEGFKTRVLMAATKWLTLDGCTEAYNEMMRAGIDIDDDGVDV